MAGFAVLDFETTGLMPEMHDRIIEIGLVLTDEHGAIEGEWTTLLNPGRDLGPTHLHGITAAQVLGAPEFGDVADALLNALYGRTIVAHNASFDMRFLHHELVRCGYPLLARPEALCTMKWGGRMIGTAKLSHCCEAVGIELTDAHEALADARATAQLLAYLLAHIGHRAAWETDIARSLAFSWPAAHAAGDRHQTLRSEPSLPTDWWLGRILEATWIPGDPEEDAAYLLCLENALLDRSISLTEGEMLLQAARTGGLTADHVEQLHRDYLRQLAIEAWADGVVTPDERADLDQLAEQLSLTHDDVDIALKHAEAAAGTPTPSAGIFLRRGDRVVFTGALARERDEWIADLLRIGLASGGITKSTRVVVTSDPDSMSGKARKARGFGVPLVDEATFTELFAEFCAAQG